MRLRRAALVVIATVCVSCASSEHSASVALDGTDLELVAVLKQSNPPLAEYHRSLILVSSSRQLQTVELFPDTGGYSLINLYRFPGERYLVRTMGNHEYLVSPAQRSISSSPRRSSRGLPEGSSFIGAFDFADGYHWRFIPAAERAELDSEIPRTVPELRPNTPYLDSSHKLILLALDGCGAEGSTAVVSSASGCGALGLRAMMESRARGANR